jgi:DHA3 family tetracycline resistance protein-like MFS transporter
LIYVGIVLTQAVVLSLGFLLHALYLIDRLHADPLQLVLAGTVLEATILVCEIPTGIIADLWSRRRSVQIGYAIIGAAWLIEAAVPRLGVALAAQVLVGLGWTCTSGATQAWLAGEIGETRVRPVMLRAANIRDFAALGTLPVAVLLGLVSLRLPLVAAGVVALVLAATLVRVMPEHGFTPTHDETRLRAIPRAMFDTARTGVRAIRQVRVLALMVPVALFLGASSEAMDRLWVAHAGGLGLDLASRGAVVVVGAVEGAGLLGSALLLRRVRVRIDTSNELRLAHVVMTLLALQTIAMLAFGVVGAAAVGVVIYLVYDITRGVQDPLYEAWLTPLAPAEVRATVLSTYGQADAIGQVAGGPGLGLIARNRSTGAAIVTGGLLLVPAMVLLGAVRRTVMSAPVSDVAEVAEGTSDASDALP